MTFPELTPEMPVLITGVKDGEIIPQSQWEHDGAPTQEFANLAEAQRAFPDLSLDRTDNPRFAGPFLHVNSDGDETWVRFDTREYYNWAWEDSQQL